jgi:hypothetical protein
MHPPAHVTSLDLIRDFRAALATFKAGGQDALTANALDVRRAMDWLTERRQSWARAVRECQDEVTQAKTELARKQVFHPGERQPDCTQEIKALKRAQARLAHAEDQVEKCKRWEPALRRACDEYEGPARQLAAVLEADLPKALNLLERQVAALEDYIAVAPRPVASGRDSAGGEKEPNPPAPFPTREGGEDSKAVPEGSPPSPLGKGVGGLGSSDHRSPSTSLPQARDRKVSSAPPP